MPTYSVTVDDRTFDISADTLELAAKKGHAQWLAMQRRAPADRPGALGPPPMSFEEFDAAVKAPR